MKHLLLSSLDGNLTGKHIEGLLRVDILIGDGTVAFQHHEPFWLLFRSIDGHRWSRSPSNKVVLNFSWNTKNARDILARKNPDDEKQNAEYRHIQK